MNVTGGATKFLFCEGRPHSLDYRLLGRLLEETPPNTQIVPSGGKQGLRAFIRGCLAGKEPEPDYVGFRDRDFDAEPPGTVTLIPLQQGKPIYLSHRASVENYLLDAGMLDRYWKENQEDAPKWPHGESPGIDDLRNWMDDAARDIACYQALRWALADLKPSNRWPELRTTWTQGSGQLPVSLADNDCITQAITLVGKFVNEAQNITEQQLLANYKRYTAMFNSSSFFSDLKYVVWFHGKDLQKAMQVARPNSISLKHFLEWAVGRFDWELHPDLQQLKSAIVSGA